MFYASTNWRPLRKYDALFTVPSPSKAATHPPPLALQPPPLVEQQQYTSRRSRRRWSPAARRRAAAGLPPHADVPGSPVTHRLSAAGTPGRPWINCHGNRPLSGRHFHVAPLTAARCQPAMKIYRLLKEVPRRRIRNYFSVAYAEWRRVLRRAAALCGGLRRAAAVVAQSRATMTTEELCSTHERSRPRLRQQNPHHRWRGRVTVRSKNRTCNYCKCQGLPLQISFE